MTQHDPAFSRAWHLCKAHSATDRTHAHALWQALQHITRECIAGPIVQCGIPDVGTTKLLLMAAAHFDWTGTILLIDTPSENGEPTTLLEFEDTETTVRSPAQEQRSALSDHARGELFSLAGNNSTIHFIQARTFDILRQLKTGQISIFYLTRVFCNDEKLILDIFYPKIKDRGLIFLTNYGTHAETTQAITEYFDQIAPGTRPYLAPIGCTGAIAIKPPGPVRKGYDFVPTGFVDPKLLHAFPTLQPADPSQVKWPWLRVNSPHIWRTDRRSKIANIGVLSYEEAIILYNLSLQFSGRRGLEIGCHLAWSTAHLLAAGLYLDVIDPALHDETHLANVRSSISAAVPQSGLQNAALYPGFSPGIVNLIRGSHQEPWSVAFIDGFHDLGAPLRDVKAVLPNMASDALIFFHDLLCPDVYEAATFAKTTGWNVRLLNTSQVMAIAWRGNVTVPEFESDPGMPIPAFGRSDEASTPLELGSKPNR